MGVRVLIISISTQYNGDDFDPVFKIRSETCLTEAQFCQNLYLIKKESLPNRPKFCRSGSSVQHLFWRLQQIQTCQCRTSCNFAKTVPCVYWLRHIIIWAMEQSMLCTAAACSEANARSSSGSNQRYLCLHKRNMPSTCELPYHGCICQKCTFSYAVPRIIYIFNHLNHEQICNFSQNVHLVICYLDVWWNKRFALLFS